MCPSNNCFFVKTVHIIKFGCLDICENKYRLTFLSHFFVVIFQCLFDLVYMLRSLLSPYLLNRVLLRSLGPY